MVTGSSAGACHRAGRRPDPLADDDDRERLIRLAHWKSQVMLDTRTSLRRNSWKIWSRSCASVSWWALVLRILERRLQRSARSIECSKQA